MPNIIFFSLIFLFSGQYKYKRKHKERTYKQKYQRRDFYKENFKQTITKEQGNKKKHKKPSLSKLKDNL